jgi:hypothetical protein
LSFPQLRPEVGPAAAFRRPIAKCCTCGERIFAHLGATSLLSITTERARFGDEQPSNWGKAQWAQKFARDPNSTSAEDAQAISGPGYSDAQIFGITAYVALRIAFSTINEALGARPDSHSRANAPEAVLEAVSYGRPIDE